MLYREPKKIGKLSKIRSWKCRKKMNLMNKIKVNYYRDKKVICLINKQILLYTLVIKM